MQTVHVLLSQQDVPLRSALWSSSRGPKQEIHNLGRNFGAVIGNEILYQLTNIADKFFGTMASQADFDQGIIPTINAGWLISAICTGQLQNSQIRPALFGALKSAEVKPEPKFQTKETTSCK